MGDVLGKLFVEPKDLPEGGYGFVQVCFLGAVYAYCLFVGSNMISDGSELLLLIPSLAGIVGSVVLPILGAVPDGAIVLFSGLGENAAEEVAVGVGALAGSTIMLLTIPWALSIIAGRVDILPTGANYARPAGAGAEWTKLTNGFSLFKTGVQARRSVAFNACIMVGTAVSYVVIQGPSSALHCSYTAFAHLCNAQGEHWWAFGGMLMCVVFFVAYLGYQLYLNQGEIEAQHNAAIVKQITSSGISVRAAFEHFFHSDTGEGLPSPGNFQRDSKRSKNRADPEAVRFSEVSRLMTREKSKGGSSIPNSKEKLFREVLHKFFIKYDSNGDGSIDVYELGVLMKECGEDPDQATIKALMQRIDKNNDGMISELEFAELMAHLLSTPAPQKVMSKTPSTASLSHKGEDEAEAEEDEEPEMPEDWKTLPVEEQQRLIKKKAFSTMALGTCIVLLFSDPMVGIFNELGTRLNVPAFYVSFVLAPLASNAAEVIASYSYALKKTQDSITISFAALEGAACMNNTFCLGIFLALVFFKGLAWEFTAETLSILFVEVVMCFVALKHVIPLWMALLVLSLYPISLTMVAILEASGLN